MIIKICGESRPILYLKQHNMDSGCFYWQQFLGVQVAESCTLQLSLPGANWLGVMNDGMLLNCESDINSGQTVKWCI